MKTTNKNQVAAFEKLLGFCNDKGAMYNPAKDSLKVTALNSLLTSAQQSLEAVNAYEIAYAKAVSVRSQAFRELPKLASEILNTLSSTNATTESLVQAKRIARKLRPPRTKAHTEAPKIEGQSGDPPLTRSASQLDYDNMVGNFANLVAAVIADSGYMPNETAFQPVALMAKVASLRGLNKAVVDARRTLSTARKNRDEALYSSSGIRGVGLSAKRYIKVVFGNGADGYGQIASLKFTNLKTS